ncbi:Transposase DDE domain-containing protein [Belnapia rosea]|nr:Transposase DDE domain-containing protein [Belnapia rosea]SDB74570.1 Transposase DDE domain-containing protein [Belnapia rosea]
MAIVTALTLRAVSRLALRQTEGLIASVLQLLGLDLPVPDHSTLSRRAETLVVSRPKAGRAPVHLLVDSTGLKLCGSGEWLEEKHGSERRRAWRVLHLATDADTGHIVASALTDRDAADGSQVGLLLDQVDGSVASFTGDGAYDRDDVYTAVATRHPEAAVIVPPRANAVPSEAAETAPTDVGIRLARSRGVRHLALEARHRRWTTLADGRATGDRDGHRRRGTEPYV